MNVRKLPKEKLNRLILVGLATLIAVAGLYFGLIRRQNEGLAGLAEKKTAASNKLKVVLGTLQRAEPDPSGAGRCEEQSRPSRKRRGLRRPLCLGD